jgi:hypothetical protein
VADARPVRDEVALPGSAAEGAHHEWVCQYDKMPEPRLNFSWHHVEVRRPGRHRQPGLPGMVHRVRGRNPRGGWGGEDPTGS